MSLFAKLRGEENGVAIPRTVGPADPALTAALVGLVAFGVIMVFSASAVFAHRLFEDGLHYLVRQAIYASVGLTVAFIAAGVDYHRYRILTYPMLLTTIVLLVLVIIGVGRTAGGATRWIEVGPVNIQPAEIAKVTIIFWLAFSLSKKRDRMESFSVGFLPHVIVSGFIMLLCLRQPDFGSAMMIGVLTFTLLYVAGSRLSYLLAAIFLTLPIVVSLVWFSDYRFDRIRGFLDPFGTRHDQGFQVAESLMSFGSGGVTGVGLGDSHQKLFFLPEAHTDFISAIIGEELGFVGIALLILTFVLVTFAGFRAAITAADEYGTYLAIGITTFIGLQAFTNLGVAMGMLPTKGLVLPFISYGGSSLIVNCGAMGVLLNVSRRREHVTRPDDASELVLERTMRNATRGARNPSLGGAA